MSSTRQTAFTKRVGYASWSTCEQLSNASSGLYDVVLTIRFDGDDSGTEFQVHRGLISYHSSHFRNALKGRSSNRKEKTITLPAFEIDSFRVFMRWMYMSRLHEPDVTFTMNTITSATEMIRAYIFANSRGIPGMKNAIIDALVEAQAKDKKIPMACLQYVWSNTAAGDGLRKLFLDWLTFNKLDKSLFDVYTQYPAEFCCQLLERVVEPASRPPYRNQEQWLQSKCQYHDHTSAEEADEATVKTQSA